MGTELESPPKIQPQIDEKGHVLLTVEEFYRLMAYLERLRKTIEDNFD